MKSSPKPLAQKSLRHRLLMSMAGGFIVILIVFSIGLWSHARQTANRSYDRLLHGAALAILERSYLSFGKIHVDIPYSAFELLGLATQDRVFYRIFTQDDITITASHNLPSAKDYRPSHKPVYWEEQLSGERVRLMQQARLLTEDDTSYWIIVQLGQTQIARFDMVVDQFWRGFAVALFITLLGLSFVWLGINRALHPLIYIERDLRKRDISDFTPLVATPPREVASLIFSINGFISRLKNNLDHSQIFIADVAHQIRTALSALQGQLELAGEAENASTFNERLGKAEKQTRQTIHLTNQLLSHAMVIHRADQQILTDVHLIPTLREILDTVLRQNVRSQVEFSVTIAPDIQHGDPSADLIAGDAISIREALLNIIDNAIKHGPPNNQIEISLFNKNGKLELKVQDAGPGIALDQREKALERFFTTVTEGEGSGLGLNIAQEVAKSHGATLVLEDSFLGGLCVKLIFIRKHRGI